MRVSDLASEYPQDALTFNVKRKTVRGKRRTLSQPSPELKKLHWRFKARLEEALGTVVLSPLGNALAHHANRYVYQFDLKDAFPSVSAVRLGARLFALDSSLGDPKEIIAFLERYCMVPKFGLAQGAPASSLLFELLAEYWLDEPIRQLLAEWESWGRAPICYTRYVDDLTFSSQEEIGQHLRYKLSEIVRKAGFNVHDRKVVRTDKSQKLATITGGRLRYQRSAVQTVEFCEELEKQLDRFLKRGLTEPAARALEGRIAWFETLERKVQGSARSRDIDRIASKVAIAKMALVQLHKIQRRKRAPKRFPKAWLQELRERADIVWYVRKCLPYDWAPKARNIKCPCPFCKTGRRVTLDRSSQTFTVSHNRQTFHCYNPTCEAHGDVIAFAMRFYGWSFVAAVIELAHEARVPLPLEYIQAHGAPVHIVPAQLTLL